MARVRVFLLTYRRPVLLRRALASLLAQTFTDWTCELHNDAPGDDAPRTVLAELTQGDPRIVYHAHEKNWGAVAGFNRLFAGGPEPYASLLEDDNWWEPGFLAAAVAEMDRRPDAALTWANMRIWQEQPDGGWTDTGRTIWKISACSAPVAEFAGPEIFQATDALHSNGAMVFRPGRFDPAAVPADMPLSIIESARERSAQGPLLFLTAPLANFALTLETARDSDAARWLQDRLLIAASFFQSAPPDAAALARLWAVRRAQQPRNTDLFFALALALHDARYLRASRFSDWLHFLPRAARHPLRLARGLRFRRDRPELWAWLVRHAPSGPMQATVVAREL